MRLAEELAYIDLGICEMVCKLADDPDPLVRLEVACAVATVRNEGTAPTLAKIAVKDANDPYLTAAVVGSLNRSTFSHFIARPELMTLAPTPLLPKLITTAVGLGDDKALSVLLAKVTTADGGKYAAWQFAAAESVLDAWQRTAKGKDTPVDVTAMFAAARTVAVDGKATDDVRTAAVRLLGREKAKLADDVTTLATLLGAKTPAPVQTAAVVALARTADDKAADAR